MIENNNTTNNNIYDKFREQLYTTPNNLPACYSTTTAGSPINTNTFKQQCNNSNGYVGTLDKTYNTHLENTSKPNEVIKPLVDYSLTNIYEPLRYLNKNNKQYGNPQAYAYNGNAAYYNQLYAGYARPAPVAQNNIGEQAVKPVPHAYNNIYAQDHQYTQQYPAYNGYSNYKSNTSYGKDKDCDYVPEEDEEESDEEYIEVEVESSDEGEGDKSPKNVSSGGECSTVDPSLADGQSDNIAKKHDNADDNAPFGNLLPKHHVDNSNEDTSATSTATGVNCNSYNNYYYGDQAQQMQNMGMIDYKGLYPQHIYTPGDMPIDASLYNWQWQMYKMPQNMYQHQMYMNNRYQSVYNQGLMYNKLMNDKWNMHDSKDKDYKPTIKRGKNSSAGRPRLNRSDYACSKCRARVTPQWRYLNGVAVCNACYMRARKEKMNHSRN